MDLDRPRLPANRNCYRLSRVSWALAEISCLKLIGCCRIEVNRSIRICTLACYSVGLHISGDWAKTISLLKQNTNTNSLNENCTWVAGEFVSVLFSSNCTDASAAWRMWLSRRVCNGDGERWLAVLPSPAVPVSNQRCPGLTGPHAAKISMSREGHWNRARLTWWLGHLLRQPIETLATALPEPEFNT